MKTLQTRRVPIPDWCPLCRHEIEGLHALVSCPLVHGVWSFSSIGSFLGPANTLAAWWNNLISNRNLRDIEIAAVIMWRTWQNRNDVVWNGKSKTVVGIFSSAMELLSQWRATNPGIVPSLIHLRQQPQWRKPPDSYLKCNVDAELFRDPPRMGYGCVLRNSSGVVIGAIHGSILDIQDPPFAEALGIREALSWLKDLHYLNILIQPHAKLVIDAIKLSSFDPSSLGMLVAECKFLAQVCSFLSSNQ